jgi:branched-chain amino acid aminotransferase
MSAGVGGAYTLRIKEWLKDIKYGREQHEWGVIINEEN